MELRATDRDQMELEIHTERQIGPELRGTIHAIDHCRLAPRAVPPRIALFTPSTAAGPPCGPCQQE